MRTGSLNPVVHPVCSEESAPPENSPAATVPSIEEKIKNVISAIKTELKPSRDKLPPKDYLHYLHHHLDHLREHLIRGQQCVGLSPSINDALNEQNLRGERPSPSVYYSAVLNSGTRAIQANEWPWPLPPDERSWLQLFAHLSPDQAIKHFNACSRDRTFFYPEYILNQMITCSKKPEFWQSKEYPEFILRFIDFILSEKDRTYTPTDQDKIDKLINSYLKGKPLFLHYIKNLLVDQDKIDKLVDACSEDMLLYLHNFNSLLEGKNQSEQKPEKKHENESTPTLNDAIENLKIYTKNTPEWNRGEAWLFIQILVNAQKLTNSDFLVICKHLIENDPSPLSLRYFHRLCSSFSDAIALKLLPECMAIVLEHLPINQIDVKLIDNAMVKAKLHLFDLFMRLNVMKIEQRASTYLNYFPHDLKQKDFTQGCKPTGYTAKTWLLILHYLIPYARDRGMPLYKIEPKYLAQNVNTYWDTTTPAELWHLDFNKEWNACMQTTKSVPSPCLTAAAAHLLSEKLIFLHYCHSRPTLLYLRDITQSIRLLTPEMILSEPSYLELLKRTVFMNNEEGKKEWIAYVNVLLDKASEKASNGDWAELVDALLRIIERQLNIAQLFEEDEKLILSKISRMDEQIKIGNTHPLRGGII